MDRLVYCCVFAQDNIYCPLIPFVLLALALLEVSVNLFISNTHDIQREVFYWVGSHLNPGEKTDL